MPYDNTYIDYPQFSVTDQHIFSTWCVLLHFEPTVTMGLLMRKYSFLKHFHWMLHTALGTNSTSNILNRWLTLSLCFFDLNVTYLAKCCLNTLYKYDSLKVAHFWSLKMRSLKEKFPVLCAVRVCVTPRMPKPCNIIFTSRKLTSSLFCLWEKMNHINIKTLRILG